MNSEERLRHFADNFEQYGPDLTHWGDRKFVIAELRKAADTIAQVTREIGEANAQWQLGGQAIAENTALRKVLEQYANPTNWVELEVCVSQDGSHSFSGTGHRIVWEPSEIPETSGWNIAETALQEIRPTEPDAASETLAALKETTEALAWLCGALRDQATGHPETLAMWNSTETVRRIEQARAVLKKQAEGATYSVGAMAGMAWRDIAASAYKAYAASTEHSAYRGLPLKEWKNLHPAIQIAWEAAARQVGECVTVIGDTLPPDEQNWAGWIPPHLKDNDNA